MIRQTADGRPSTSSEHNRHQNCHSPRGGDGSLTTLSGEQLKLSPLSSKSRNQSLEPCQSSPWSYWLSWPSNMALTMSSMSSSSNNQSPKNGHQSYLGDKVNRPTWPSQCHQCHRHQTTSHPITVIIISQVMKLTVQHDPLPPGFKEISVVKQPGEKLGMIIKGGLRWWSWW